MVWCAGVISLVISLFQYILNSTIDTFAHPPTTPLTHHTTHPSHHSPITPLTHHTTHPSTTPPTYPPGVPSQRQEVEGTSVTHHPPPPLSRRSFRPFFFHFFFQFFFFQFFFFNFFFSILFFNFFFFQFFFSIFFFNFFFTFFFNFYSNFTFKNVFTLLSFKFPFTSNSFRNLSHLCSLFCSLFVHFLFTFCSLFVHFFSNNVQASISMTHLTSDWSTMLKSHWLSFSSSARTFWLFPFSGHLFASSFLSNHSSSSSFSFLQQLHFYYFQ